MKKYELRLRDLDNISSKEPDYTGIMKELGYRNYLFNRHPRFTKYFIESHKIIEEGRQIDPKNIEPSPDCKILRPNNIDDITFKAMMELRAVAGTKVEKGLMGVISEMITIACFKTNHQGNYDSKSNRFKWFRQRVLNAPLVEMFGLYNWIYKSLKESNIMWEKRFMTVKVDDNDYEEAGGQRMGQFNVINTLKKTIRDFNCTKSEAWQTSYSLTQTNSYEEATRNHTQDEMRKIKERNMKRDRKKNG